MKTLLIVFGVLLYLYIGCRIFEAAVNNYGGPDEYMEYIAEENSKTNPQIAYALAYILVMTAWPYFITKAMIDRRK